MNDPAATIRGGRTARGLRQGDLAELLGVTQPFVSQMERGRVELPSPAVRAKFVEYLGLDPFAERAAQRHRKVSASEFARRTRIDIHSVLRLIAEDLLPAHFLGDGLGYELDERAALAALQELDRCRYEGCDEPATTETGCCGEHAQKQWALEARGTRRPADVGERIRLAHLATHADPERGPRWRAASARALRGKPRPDVRERYQHDWEKGGPLTLALFYTGDGTPRRRFKPETREKYGRKHAKAIAALRGKKPGPKFTKVDADIARAILQLKDQKRSEREIVWIIAHRFSVDLSKTAVHNVIANRREVIDHFMLDDLV